MAHSLLQEISASSEYSQRNINADIQLLQSSYRSELNSPEVLPFAADVVHRLQSNVQIQEVNIRTAI